MNIRNTPRSQNGMLHSVRLTELRVKNNSRQRMNFPSENSTIISAYVHSAQTYEALPVSMIRRAGLIQKLRSFSCSAIFQFASQNGMLLTDHFEAVFVKNNSRQGMNFLWKFNHFMRFRAFRSDIFLTLRLLQNNLEAYPFCSELRLSVYQPPASAISQ